MKGKFIGKSSMGFQNGVIYDIRSDIRKVKKCGKFSNEEIMCICIQDTNSDAWCPYQSLEVVLENWEIYK